MYLYVPVDVADSPPIIVAIHYCTGTAQAYYEGTPYAQLADQYGFIVSRAGWSVMLLNLHSAR